MTLEAVSFPLCAYCSAVFQSPFCIFRNVSYRQQTKHRKTLYLLYEIVFNQYSQAQGNRACHELFLWLRAELRIQQASSGETSIFFMHIQHIYLFCSLIISRADLYLKPGDQMILSQQVVLCVPCKRAPGVLSVVIIKVMLIWILFYNKVCLDEIT